MNSTDESITELREIIDDGNLLHVRNLLESDDVGMDESGTLVNIDETKCPETARRRKKAVLDGDLTLEEANSIFGDGNL